MIVRTSGPLLSAKSKSSHATSNNFGYPKFSALYVSLFNNTASTPRRQSV